MRSAQARVIRSYGCLGTGSFLGGWHVAVCTFVPVSMAEGPETAGAWPLCHREDPQEAESPDDTGPNDPGGL